MTQLFRLLWQSHMTVAVYLPVVVLVVVLAVRDRRKFSANWEGGALVAIVWFLLCLPAMVFTMTHPDILGAAQQGGPTAEGQRAAVMMLFAALTIGFTLKVLQVPWYAVVYHVAAEQWGAIRPDAFPIIQRKPAPWRAIVLAGAFGIVAAAVSAGAFRLLHADVPDALKQFSAATPAAAQTSLWVRLPLLGLAAAGTALTDELVLRGALLGWLLRGGSNQKLAAVEAALLVSVYGACLAVVSTGAPPAVAVQVFVIGLFLCEFARRSCVEAAVAAHVGLNVAALLIAAAIG